MLHLAPGVIVEDHLSLGFAAFFAESPAIHVENFVAKNSGDVLVHRRAMKSSVLAMERVRVSSDVGLGDGFAHDVDRVLGEFLALGVVDEAMPAVCALSAASSRLPFVIREMR